MDTDIKAVCTASSGVNLTLPEVTYGTLGDPVTLPATFSTDRRVMNIAWYKLDPREPTSRTQIFSYYPPLQTRESYGDYVGRTSLEDQASLRIARTKPADEGKYILSVSVEGVGSSEGQVQLFLMVPPTLRVGPSNPYVTAWGKPALLTCAVQGAKPNVTSLHWEKNGVMIDTSGSHTKFVGGNLQRPALHIRHVGRADSGVYACVADHVVTVVRASLALNVYYPSSVLSISDSVTATVVTYPSSVLSISDSVTATVSDHITLQCVTDGNPPPNITWSRDGVWLPSTSSRLTRDAWTSTLQLRDVTVNDSGTYWCRTSNRVGRGSSRSLQVTIRESRLGIGISTLAVVVGATDSVLAIVVCVALSTYIVRRRRLQCGKKRIPVYPKAVRQQPARVEGTAEPSPYASAPYVTPPATSPHVTTRYVNTPATSGYVTRSTTSPHVTTPDKPPNGTACNGGINTIRRTLGQKS
ncbi:hemicentin-2-like [Branchiostoma floridae]|uniref:Hemicentin-2-like n=1 Tax=Branchiostoma floridae TaxID=7739 RepID=A0A9J7MBH0_BRAFL|nr:hemicentin-2-like [Branchiostoma floridae]